MKKINLITITAVLFGLVFAASFSYGAEEKDQELKEAGSKATSPQWSSTAATLLQRKRDRKKEGKKDN